MELIEERDGKPATGGPLLTNDKEALTTPFALIIREGKT
jgi:hypothetical protein